jgi:hypothetical protein
MTSAWAKTVCRLLAALTLCTSHPSAQAALIGTGDALQASSERGTVLNFLGRSDVARELRAFGLDPATARDRVAALSDDEARSLAGGIDALPAGADVAGLLLFVCIVALIWWAWPR